MLLSIPMSPPAGALRILAAGDWQADQVRVLSVASTWHAPPGVPALIDAAWETSARSGITLFDGPMCRLERFTAAAAELSLQLSETTYRIFVGTHLYHSDLADTYGPQVLANSVGVSVLLRTADGFLLLGRRNESVVYYPGRLHPFAGALEPCDGGNPFVCARRELQEEAGLLEPDLSELRCIGIVEDHQLRQPELILRAQTPLLRAQVDARLAPEEHHELIAIEATDPAIRIALRDPALTPVAAGALFLWGRSEWGDLWLEQTCEQFKMKSQQSNN
jgi:8-oxo-dGTP pyrophosphatase MutT (NUDIX family)